MSGRERLRRWNSCPGISLLLAAGVLHACHYAVLAHGFLLPYVDADQLVIADMAVHFAGGSLPEPFFWGQNYLLPVEAYLAVPLVWTGVRADIATLATAALCFYAPFGAMAWLLARRQPWAAAIVAAAPLAMPLHGLLVALMPRGFIGAAGLGALAAIVFVGAARAAVRVACAGVLGICIAAYPPAALMTPALLLPRLDLATAILAGAALAAGAGAVALAGQAFYGGGQNVVHPQWAVSFSPETLAVSLGDWAVVGPMVRAVLWIPLAAVLLVAFAPACRASRTRRFWLALAVLGALVLGMFGTSKIGDAAPSVFFSAHRFWLALPYVLLSVALHAALHAPAGRLEGGHRAVWLLLAGGALSIAVTHVRLGPVVSAEASRRAPVAVAPRAHVADACQALARSIDRRQYYFAIDGRNDLFAYGCFPLAGLYVTQTEYERRTWLPGALGTRTPLPFEASRPRF